MKLLFSKVTGEISAFCNCVENSVTFIALFRKAALFKIPAMFLKGVVGLQSADCNATKNELPTKFFKDVLKTLEKF